jgi:hypothetical protein
MGVAVDRIEEGQAQAKAMVDRLEAALAAVEAAKAGAAGGSGGSGGGNGGSSPGPLPIDAARRGAPGYPHNRPHPISWSDRIHICYGDEDDETKGGHLAGIGRPGKTEFPPDWDEEAVVEALVAVATRPEVAYLQSSGKWVVRGLHEGVTVDAVVRPDGSIEAGWPVSGPGVRRNPPSRK